MSDVHVTFPAAGKMFIDNDPESVVSGRRLEWHFVSHRPEVEFVEIVFDEDAGAGSKDATVSSPKPWIFKVNNVWNRSFQKKMEVSSKGNSERRLTIWAEPATQGSPQKRRKYTIIAKDAGNSPIQELVNDPVIIIDDP